LEGRQGAWSMGRGAGTGKGCGINHREGREHGAWGVEQGRVKGAGINHRGTEGKE